MPRYYIKTYGCQMNVNDSEVLAGMLESMGYSEAENPEDADVILVNTCTVRQRAEDKAYTFIYDLRKLKVENSELIVGICGCLPQQEKEGLFKKFPFVDFVLGPASIHELGSLIVNHKSKIGMLIETCNPETRNLPQARKPSTTAYISITYGCDNYCSFCIVPYVRGREVSRSKEDILREINGLDKSLFKEVVLLGQNVNSYKNGLAGLLRAVSDLEPRRSVAGSIDQIERIRFLTSHPRDMTDDIIQAVRELPKVCEYFHLPLQSGDDEILKKMNRGYTIHYYICLVDRIRKAIPEAAITSDVVVGFPGETDKKFKNTLKAIENLELDSVNTAAYSDRRFTAASKMADKIPDDVKSERLQEVMRVVEDVAFRKNQNLVGKTVEILVDSPGTGRTRTNKIVKFDGGPSQIGKLVNVKIKSAKSWVLQAS